MGVGENTPHICSPILLIPPTSNGLSPDWVPPPPPPIYKSMLATQPEWTPLSLSCPFPHHSIHRGINILLENYCPPNRAIPLENKFFFDYSQVGQTYTMKMRIFWPFPNFHGFPDFRLISDFRFSFVKGCVRYIFASLFFKSKQEPLSN